MKKLPALFRNAAQIIYGRPRTTFGKAVVAETEIDTYPAGTLGDVYSVCTSAFPPEDFRGGIVRFASPDHRIFALLILAAALEAGEDFQ